jgi:Phage tail repeat like
MANIDPFLTDLGTVELTTKWVVKEGAAPAGHHTTSQLLTLLDTLYVTGTYGNATWAAISHTHTASAITDFNAAADARVAAGIATHEAAGDPHPQYLTAAEGNAAYSAAGHTHSGLAPVGGAAGEVLKKVSGTDYDYSWQADATGGGIADGDKGDITVSASGATWTIDANVVTNAKAAQMATKTYKGRTSAATGDAEDVPVATLKTDLALTKSDVGLANVDNTSDANKPVSTATQTALNLKANLAGPTFTGTVSGITAAMVGAPSGSGSSSGTNTGDQTSIVGITGTKAQFDTAVTDGNFMYVGDAPTAHTHSLANISDVTMTVANLNALDDGVNTALHFHNTDRDRANHTGTQLSSTVSDFNEAAQDAVGAMVDSTLTYVDATPSMGRAAITGHISIPAGSNTAALSSFTLAQLNTAISDADVANATHTHTLANISDVTMTVANLNSLDDGVNTALHFHDADRARANHTGTQLAATISDFAEAVDDRVGALLVPGTNVTLVYDDVANSLTINSTASGGGAVQVLDEGVSLTAAVTSLNFVGAGVTATNTGAAVTVTIAGGSGSGDVVGPASSTDNAIARFDLATGKLLQNSGVLVTDAGEMDLPYVSTFGTPAADHMRLFAGKSGGRMMPRFVGPNGQDTTLQPHVGKNKIAQWNASGNGTTITADGAPALTATGTATAVNVAQTSFTTRLRRLEYLVTAASTTAVAGFRVGAVQWTIGDPTLAVAGGFHYVCTWANATGAATTTNRCFVGMANSTAAPTDVEPSSIANIVGMGWDAADTNIQIMHRGAGAITKIDLGSNFPVPSADRANSYMLEMYSPPGTTQVVNWRVTNLSNTQVAEGQITTNMPTAATYLGPRGWMSVGGTSSVIGIALSGLYVETDF